MSAIAHVGIAVPDVVRAARWYRELFGFEPLGPVAEVRAGEGHSGTVAADVLGPGFSAFRQAHLTGANGVALELFEFDRVPSGFGGLFHLCVLAPDVARTARRIASHGGRRTSRVWQVYEHEPYRNCYCRDPFGNVIELYSHSHERVHSNRGPGA
jgi:catechol 2,3-dioxygenase-like lactoylglutathione lyase family enzyme